MGSSERSVLNRRRFVGLLAGGVVTSSFLGDRIIANPYSPVQEMRVPSRPVRISGIVRSSAGPVEKVAVSDGMTVVQTAPDGTYELLSRTSQPFVHVSLPSGYRIPQSQTGTANFYRQIQPGRNGEMEAVFELEPLVEESGNFRFLLLSDPQTEDFHDVELLHRESVPDVRELIRTHPDVEFRIGCGDLMWDNLELYPEYEKAVRRMGVPFFQVVGNHDLDLKAPTNRESTLTFQRHFGPSYYSFNRGAVHFAVLNDVFWFGESYLGYLTREQLDWLREDLKLVSPGTLLVIAMHIPGVSSRYLRDGDEKPGLRAAVQNRQELYRIVEPFRTHILSGHTHESEHVFQGGVHEHIHGTVCGAWWTGPVCADGTPSGYGVYEVKGEELRWVYKATGRPLSEQFSAYAAGFNPTSQPEMLVNVWNWDPDWKVRLYEDGVAKGQMQRQKGHDLESVRLHMGPNLPVQRSWIEPYPTEHLFGAAVSRESREIRIEVEDRFGNLYVKTV